MADGCVTQCWRQSLPVHHRHPPSHQCRRFPHWNWEVDRRSIRRAEGSLLNIHACLRTWRVCDPHPATSWTSVSASSSRKSTASFSSPLLSSSSSSSSSSRTNVLSSSRCAWREERGGWKGESCIIILYYEEPVRIQSVVCMAHTVMPSLDLRASSMTVVMAVRWGVRHSGLTVDTAEYRLYLTEGSTGRGVMWVYSSLYVFIIQSLFVDWSTEWRQNN